MRGCCRIRHDVLPGSILQTRDSPFGAGKPFSSPMWYAPSGPIATLVATACAGIAGGNPHCGAPDPGHRRSPSRWPSRRLRSAVSRSNRCCRVDRRCRREFPAASATSALPPFSASTSNGFDGPGAGGGATGFPSGLTRSSNSKRSAISRVEPRDTRYSFPSPPNPSLVIANMTPRPIGATSVTPGKCATCENCPRRISKIPAPVSVASRLPSGASARPNTVPVKDNEQRPSLRTRRRAAATRSRRVISGGPD